MKDLSIYIHIPFCVRKCLYCDFLSAPACNGEMRSYVNCLLREIEKQSIFYGDHRVVSIFLGGGTPSLLSAQETGRILERVRARFSLAEDAEITIECNPGTATAEKLKNYITYGINRLSIGLQSTDDGELERIGRIHNYRDFLETYELAREEGFRNINIDLMAALPGQSLASYRKTLERVIALSPEHISAYSLILEEGTPLYVNRGLYTFPDEDEEREMYELTEKVLGEARFHRYEISNYAQAGYECRHNKVYWRRGDYVGFGLGASSMVGNVRWKNPDTHADYAAYVEKMEPLDKSRAMHIAQTRAEWMSAAGAREVQPLTLQEQMEEFMFLGLRLTNGVRKQDFQEKFGVPIETVYEKELEELQRDGLLIVEESVRLTPYGTDISNYVMAKFLFG